MRKKWFLFLLITLVLPVSIKAITYTTYPIGTSLGVVISGGSVTVGECNIGNPGCKKFYVLADSSDSDKLVLLYENTIGNNTSYSGISNIITTYKGYGWPDSLRLPTGEEILKAFNYTETMTFGENQTETIPTSEENEWLYTFASGTAYWLDVPQINGTGQYSNEKYRAVVRNNRQITTNRGYALETKSDVARFRPVIEIDKSTYANLVTTEIDYGTIEVNLDYAKEDDEISFTYTINDGHELSSIKVTDEDDNEISVDNNKFNMPDSDVKILIETKVIEPSSNASTDNIVNNPKTNDNISFYILVLGFSMIGLISMSIHTRKLFD